MEQYDNLQMITSKAVFHGNPFKTVGNVWIKGHISGKDHEYMMSVLYDHFQIYRS